MSIKETAVLMPISSLCKRRGDDIKTKGSARLGVARGRSATTGTITGCNIASLQDSIRVLRSIPAFSSPRSPRFWGRTDQPRQQSPDKAWERSMISIAKCCELCVCDPIEISLLTQRPFWTCRCLGFETDHVIIFEPIFFLSNEMFFFK